MDSPSFLSSRSLFLYLSRPPTASNPMHHPPPIQTQYSNKSHSPPPQTPNPRSTKQNNHIHHPNSPTNQTEQQQTIGTNQNYHITTPKSEQTHTHTQILEQIKTITFPYPNRNNYTHNQPTNQPATTVENLKNTTLKPQTPIIVAVGTPVSDFKLRSSLQ